MLRFQAETPGLLTNLADSLIHWWKRRLPRYCRPSRGEIRELYRGPIDFLLAPAAPLWYLGCVEEHGSAWLWDDFVIIDADLPPARSLFQRFELSSGLVDPGFQLTPYEADSGMLHFNILYLHSFHVFWRNGLPLSGYREYLTPSLILTIEIRALTINHWSFGFSAGSSDRVWPLVGKGFTKPYLCAFISSGRVVHGSYLGPWNAPAAKRELFRRLRKEFRLKGKPQRLGGKYAAFGHPATGWPPFQEVVNEAAQIDPFLATADILRVDPEIH